jgi:pilus assembly protein CpaC
MIENVQRGAWIAAMAIMAMTGPLADIAAWAQQAQPTTRPQRPVTLETTRDRYAGEFQVPVNKSQVLRLQQPYTDLAVGNPAIADVLPLTNQTVYVLGKAIGATNLLIYGAGRQLTAVVDLTVIPDAAGLRARLHELFPKERIEVRASGGTLVLGGVVSSAIVVNQALAVAQRYAGAEQADRGVTNLMSVRGSQQVMLAVRFAEVSRDVLKEIGFNLTSIFRTGDTSITLRSGSGVSSNAFFAGSLLTNLGSLSIAAFFDALEEKGLAKILAEPNLVALSGDTANFLAGGEFPIPAAQTSAAAGGQAAITIEFKQFGVSLAFTPTIIDDSRINLIVAPEVSEPDFSIAVTTCSGCEPVPGLRTRRAQTTVELGNGQSFAIAGLLQSRFSNSIDQFPWLGDIPILGLLFRSAQYRRNETELVIVVTPYIVKPTAPDQIVTPADRFIPPTESEIFLYGRLAGTKKGPTAAAGQQVDTLKSVGGISGPYGHVVK